MEKFDILKAIAAPLLIQNIDTDMIIPKQFLKTIQRSGLGKHAFHELRYHEDGQINQDFILNQKPYNQAQILIAGTNFGCGSSREHAPWALKDFGIRCVISDSFADIFYSNCFENSILPAIVTKDEIQILSEYSAHSDDKELTVNLQTKEIIYGDLSLSFKIGDFEAERLLNGLDSIGLTLQKEEFITAFEQKRHKTMPWI